jgi:excisionase family DNA binding protein
VSESRKSRLSLLELREESEILAAAREIARAVHRYPTWMDAREAARYLGMHLTEFRKLTKSEKDFPEHRISERRVRYYREELDEWLLRR